MDSPLSYVGGKSKLSPKIIPLIPDHKTYCEVFTGAGWIFFRKEPSKIEIVNDLDGDLIAFYRVLQNHLEEFLRQFKFVLTSREWFEDWNNQLKGRGLTDIQKAARYYYVQRLCFGGKVRGRTYGASYDRPPKVNLVRMEEELSEVHLRLSKVTIENLPWDQFVLKYAKPKTFFYLDPPYYQAPCYKHNFDKIDDFQHLRDVLLSIDNDFILSINDHPDIREVFSCFQMIPVSLNYSIGRNKGKKANELLISRKKLEK